MTHDSGQLPMMVEVNGDGVQWSEETVSPPNSETEDSRWIVETIGEDDCRHSPHSTTHMGVSPPQPSITTNTTSVPLTSPP